MSSLTTLTYLIFAYTTVEGLIVNMMYPSTVAFIFKDFAIVLAYLASLTTPTPVGSLRRLAAPLGGFAFVTFLFLGMPSQVAFIGELVAIKQRLFYIPLAWIGYKFVVDEKAFLGLARVMAWTAIPACLFGVYLFFVGPSGLAAIGANYSSYIGSTAGSHGISFWRVPGTFTSPGQYGGFLLINAVLFAGVMLDSRVQGSQRRLTMVALVCSLSALLVSGSRAPLLLFILCGIAILIVIDKIHGIGIWAAGLYGVMTAGYSLFGDGVRDRVGSIASWEHVERFKETYLGQLFWQMMLESPMGFGLGRATLGARHFTEWSNIMLVESYFGIVVAETGVLGLLSFSAALLAIMAALVRGHAIMRNAPSRAIYYAAVLPVAITAFLTPINTSMDSAPGNLYFWFFLGAGIKLCDLEVERRRIAAGAGVLAAPARQAVYPVSYQ